MATKGTTKLALVSETLERFRKLSTLFEGLEAAELLDLLADEGPYTIFAPSNEAFEHLPEGVWDELLEPENEDKLFEVLSYHIIPEKLGSTELAEKKLATLNGSIAQCQAFNGQLGFEEATIIESDIECSNGVIHVIDAVIIPE